MIEFSTHFIFHACALCTLIQLVHLHFVPVCFSFSTPTPVPCAHCYTWCICTLRSYVILTLALESYILFVDPWGSGLGASVPCSVSTAPREEWPTALRGHSCILCPSAVVGLRDPHSWEIFGSSAVYRTEYSTADINFLQFIDATRGHSGAQCIDRLLCQSISPM